MSLIVYNFDFEPIFEEQKVKSTSWDIYYNRTGTFEAHLPLTSELTGITAENKYLVIDDGGKRAIITGKEIKNELVLYGRTPNWILEKRIAPKTSEMTDDAGNICKNLVINAFSDVANFVASVPLSTENVTVERTSFQTVNKAICDCLSLCNYGHRVDFDTASSKWIFTVFCGQEIPLLISEANKNAYDTSVCEDILDLADGGYYGEDSYIGSGSGICHWDCILEKETEAEAITLLNSKKENSKISLKLRDLRLGRDYNLGDTVRVQIIKGNYRATKKKMITGVHISNNGGNTEESPILEDLGGI